MKRISNEDGRDAGARNFGRLALAIIPLVLGLAASVWLGIWIESHYFLIDVRQEQRRGQMVGAPVALEDPLAITTPVRLQTEHLAIDRAEYSSGELTVRFHATHDTQGFELHWAWISPDGTHMGQGWDKVDVLKGPWSLASGEKGIVTDQNVGIEPRASTLEVWMESE